MPGETISVAIGQGQVSVTPASLAVMIATVANGGTRVTPHVIKAVDDGDGWKPVSAPAVADRVAFRPETLAALHDGLWMVVNAAGTGGRARIAGRDVAGKTGTAQVISNQGRAGGAQAAAATCATTAGSSSSRRRTTREIAGVIFGEHNEHGYLGAPIAKHVIETYFAKKEGQPLPMLDAGRRRRCRPNRPRYRDRRGPMPFADAGRGGHRLQPCTRARRLNCTVFERRLYHPRRLGAARRDARAVRDRALAQIYSATGGLDGDRTRRRSTASCSGWSRCVVCLSIDYRTLADKSHFIYVGVLAAAGLRAVLRRRPRRIAALDRSGRVQPPAVRVRQGGAGAGAREVLRRQPPRRAHHARPCSIAGAR